LIVADGRTDGAATEAWLERLAGGHDARLLMLPGSTEAALIDAGVRAAAGAYVNVLHADDAFHPERIERLVDDMARHGQAWGFSGVDFVDARGVPVALGHEQRPLPEIIAASDTVGWSFVHQQYVGVVAGNLFFSPSLFEAAGGMGPLMHGYAWDFCLRALWHEEPVYVPASLYRRVVAEDVARPPVADAAEHAIFSDFYARACSEAAPNPFAPCVQHWRRH